MQPHGVIRHPWDMPSPEQNKARVLDLIERCINEYDPSVVHQFTSNPRVIEFQTRALESFPDMHSEVRWTVAEEDRVVTWQHFEGTHLGPWIFAPEATGRFIQADVVVAFQFGDDGQIIDQSFCTNFIAILEQMGGSVVPPSGATRSGPQA